MAELENAVSDQRAVRGIWDPEGLGLSRCPAYWPALTVRMVLNVFCQSSRNL